MIFTSDSAVAPAKRLVASHHLRMHNALMWRRWSTLPKPEIFVDGVCFIRDFYERQAVALDRTPLAVCTCFINFVSVCFSSCSRIKFELGICDAINIKSNANSSNQWGIFIPLIRR